MTRVACGCGRSRRSPAWRVGFVGVALLVWSDAASADIGPPVKIVMPADVAPATANVEYRGVFEVHVGRPGTLTSFTLQGQGWTVLSLDAPVQQAVKAGEVVVVSFVAIPADPSQALEFAVSFDGRRARKYVTLSQENFDRLRNPRPVRQLVRVDEGPHPAIPPTTTVIPAAPRKGAGSEGGGVAGGAITLRFRGRFGYVRQDGPFIGADGFYVAVRDSDFGPDETIWEGLTDVNGFFDVTVSWDDCDIFGCDDPDIYAYFETETGVVIVQSSDALEVEYSWETGEIEDFTGSEVDFGTLAPGDPADDPAVHIHNSVTKAWRFIITRDGTDVESVDVQWPDGASGAWYNDYWEEIHIGVDESWPEGTHTHEYGHHFMNNYSDDADPSYCNGICDAPDDCGHCAWCPENAPTAWTEGWPNWLGSVVNRSYLADYGFAPLSINDGRYVLEGLATCPPNPLDPAATEGYAGALCRDLEDFDQDNHNTDTLRDELCLGANEVFQVVRIDRPQTVSAFITAFRNRFPQFNDRFVRTVFNVDPSFSPFAHACCATGGPGCWDLPTQNCVCDSDSYCCTTAWDGQCAGEVTSFGCGSCLPNAHSCCASGAAGCDDVAIRTCVCAQDPVCCTIVWDDVCVIAVNALGCGTCLGSHPCTQPGGPGCNNPVVQTCVCNSDPYCCNTEWDQQCVDEVNGFDCHACGAIPHACCTTGDEGCTDSAIQACVCGGDPYCCETEWDQLCIDDVDLFGCGTCGGCGPGNPNNCFSVSPNGTSGCREAGCCDTVCAADGFCCDTAWDGICADEAVTMCGGCGPGNPNSCFAESPGDTPGCNRFSCCAAVCAADPFCCTTQWDEICAGEGGSLCAPANNACENALPIFDGATEFDTFGASTDGPSEPACLFFGDDQVNQDIWFSYAATCTGILSVELCESAYDTKLSLNGPGASCAGSVLACNDDACGAGGLRSALSAPVTGGVTYKLRIGGYGSESGPGLVSVSCTGVPANDDCANSILVPDGVTPFSTTGATTDGPPNPACLFFGDDQVNQDIWFRYVATCTGPLSVELCGSGYDTKLSLHGTGETCAGPILACNDDSTVCGDGSLQSAVSAPVTAGSTYKVRVGGYDGATGTGLLTIACGVCSADADCSDGLTCNGAERCVAGGCQSGTPPDCSDGIACTSDACDEAADVCTHTPSHASCGDGLYCNGAEVCSVAGGGCLPGAPPCAPGLTCDEAMDTCVGTPCPPGSIVGASPPNGTIDARQPSPPGGGPLQGIGSAAEPIVIQLSSDVTGAAAECFSLCETDTGGMAPNGIATAMHTGGGSYSIVLDRPITPGAVTTISYEGASGFVSFGSHPANANADSLAAPTDILFVINMLNGVGSPPYGMYSQDIDHSGGFNPADILRTIDLLNGADAYIVWNGTPRPVNTSCP